MRIFGKHIFRSIKANPYQPILITLIVSLCVAVMILSVALPINIYKNESAAMLVDEWTADIEITLKSTSDRRIIFDDEVSGAIKDRGRVIGEFSLTGFCTPRDAKERCQVEIGAFDLVEADNFYSLDYIQHGKITNTNLKSVAIISEGFSKEHEFLIGDEIGINVLGREFLYTVGAIAKETGIMKSENMLVDISGVRAALAERSPLIASLSSELNPYTKIHIKLHDGIDPAEVKAELESLSDFSDKRIYLPRDSTKNNYTVTVLTVTALIPAVLLLIVAALMTVSTFDLLQKKRQEDLALFRIVGADTGCLNGILYFESSIYGAVGGIFGSLISAVLMLLINRLYGFKYSTLSFDFIDALIGILSSMIFTALCTLLYIRKQKKKSDIDRLKSGNLKTDAAFVSKMLIFAALIAVILISTFLLPVNLRFIGAVLLLFTVVLLIYTVSPYIIGTFASLVCLILSRKRRGAGNFILAAKSCRNSYPLRHAGRIMTVLITAFMALNFVLSAVEAQLESYAGIARFEHIGLMADSGTRDKTEKLEGVVATAEATIKSNVTIGKKTAIGISISGDAKNCFAGDMLPENMPKGNAVALTSGVARMLGAKPGDTLKLTIGGIPCELILTEIVRASGDFVFYDAAYIGVEYDMFCVRTNGNDVTYQELMALFDERGVGYISRDEFFLGVHKRVNPQVVIFKAMFVTMILMTAVGIFNVLSEERMARLCEFDIIRQNGKTKRGILALQLVEISYLFLSAFIMSAIFSYIICLITDVAAVSFGMTLYP